MITEDMNTNNIIIATMIRNARKQAKLTQQQVVDRYQIPRSTLQDWESGKHVPPMYIVNLLLRCLEADFGVSIDQTAITEQVNTDTTYTLTYTDGTPLSTADEMYILKEKKAKRIELVEMDKDNSRVRIYKCQNGLIFKGTRN
jgi:transcriptional regulator with XRE-family HTH domain